MQIDCNISRLDEESLKFLQRQAKKLLYDTTFGDWLYAITTAERRRRLVEVGMAEGFPNLPIEQYSDHEIAESLVSVVGLGAKSLTPEMAAFLHAILIPVAIAAAKRLEKS